jgi:hypothetical protein
MAGAIRGDVTRGTLVTKNESPRFTVVGFTVIRTCWFKVPGSRFTVIRINSI